MPPRTMLDLILQMLAKTLTFRTWTGRRSCGTVLAVHLLALSMLLAVLAGYGTRAMRTVVAAANPLLVMPTVAAVELMMAPDRIPSYVVVLLAPELLWLAFDLMETQELMLTHRVLAAPMSVSAMPVLVPSTPTRLPLSKLLLRAALTPWLVHPSRRTSRMH